MNARGVAAYQFDTSLGGPNAGDCFGDQPKTGFDNNALVISTDEYCGPTESNYEGAIVLAISKSQLVHEAATVNDSVLGPVSLSGIPVTGLDPAIDTGARHRVPGELVPVPDAAGNNNPVADTLGVWTLRNDASVTTGHGTPVLTGTAIRERAVRVPGARPRAPVTARSPSRRHVITSEAALNPDDSRMSGAGRGHPDPGRVQLWTALDAAVTFKGGTATGDAAAWFAIDPTGKRVVSQGYVVAKGANLLYPAIQPQQFGPAAMVFTITSTSDQPERRLHHAGLGRITTVAAGAGPAPELLRRSSVQRGPLGRLLLRRPRSRAAPASGWPPSTSRRPPTRIRCDNWGTYVFEVSGH